MSGRKALLILSIPAVGLLAAGLSVFPSRDDEGHMLVMRIFELAGPPESQADTGTRSGPTRRDRPAPSGPPPIRGLPSETCDPREAGSILDTPVPTSVRAEYGGTWVERSIGKGKITTLTTTFARSGAFLAEALVRDREDGTTLRVSTRGRWSIDEEGTLLMAVEETDAPGIIPVGFVQRCASSSVSGRDWTYEDGEGRLRIARRR